MPLLGYGEDALTLHALTKGLPTVFDQLGDDTDPGKAVIFYRPSFGRRSSAGAPRSEFGEFDAIIGTARAVYAVEAKWSASGELDGQQLTLRPEQLRRHQAFRLFFDEWRRDRPVDWTSFVARMIPLLKTQIPSLVPAAAGTTLARNLECVLRRLETCGPSVVDVLLFCRLSPNAPAPLACGSFKVITYSCPVELGGFVRLTD